MLKCTRFDDFSESSACKEVHDMVAQGLGCSIALRLACSGDGGMPCCTRAPTNTTFGTVLSKIILIIDMGCLYWRQGV